MIFPDEEGLEFSTIEKVEEEAARSLADMARDAVRALGGDSQKLSIEVRDESGPRAPAQIHIRGRTAQALRPPPLAGCAPSVGNPSSGLWSGDHRPVRGAHW